MDPNEEKLAQFIEDSVMYNAVKAILYAHFDANSLELVPRSERDTAVQAIFDGRKYLDKGFKDLERFRRRDASNKDENNPNGV